MNAKFEEILNKAKDPRVIKAAAATIGAALFTGVVLWVIAQDEELTEGENEAWSGEELDSDPNTDDVPFDVD